LISFYACHFKLLINWVGDLDRLQKAPKEGTANNNQQEQSLYLSTFKKLDEKLD
jgi:hypothetical protein